MSQFWKPGTQKPQTLVIEDDEGGVIPFAVLPSSSSGYGYMSLEKQRQRLPVFKQRTAILFLVENHATTIIIGETGSGKTTQIPQYLKEAGWAEGGRLIACTQPRRLAVQGVTMIKFLTDGVLLREMTEDPLLTKYSGKKRHQTDGKEPLPSREPAILSVEGRAHDVRIHFLEEPVPDYVQAAVSTVLSIHGQEPQGDILVFMTGQDDVDAAVNLINEEAQKLARSSSAFPAKPKAF